MIDILNDQQRELIERNMDCIQIGLSSIPPSKREEYLPDAYVKICEIALEKFESEEHFRKTVVAAIKNMAIDIIRKNKRHNSLFVDDGRDVEEKICCSDESLDKITFLEFVKTLKEEEKYILLYKNRGYTYREIAEQIGVDKWIITYMVKKLKIKYLEWIGED